MNIYKTNGEHIGKRWAAGIWCWSCKIEAEHDVIGLFWYCPRCGARCSEKTLFNPAMRELGFDKSKERKRSGVDGASGFIWHAKNKQDAMKKFKKIRKCKTEYGESWTAKRFWRMFNDVIEESYSDDEFC